jgi:outer membrane biogenesis lipoprotein LolB
MYSWHISLFYVSIRGAIVNMHAVVVALLVSCSAVASDQQLGLQKQQQQKQQQQQQQLVPTSYE